METAYIKNFRELYSAEISTLAKKLGVSVEDEKFSNIVRVVASLLKMGDYSFGRDIEPMIEEYYKDSFHFNLDIMENVGFKDQCTESPIVYLYPENFYEPELGFSLERFAVVLSGISEMINNLIRKQPYHDHDIKKDLLNHRPITIQSFNL